jgi:TonB family protein
MVYERVALLVCLLVLSVGTLAQRVATLTPDDAEQSRRFASLLNESLAGKFRVLDDELSRAAFDSFNFESPFNLTVGESRKAAAAIGCDMFILVRSSTLRRSASDRPEYYDANAAVFLVSGRTGKLLSFQLARRETARSQTATAELMDQAKDVAAALVTQAAAARQDELQEPPRSTLEEVPEPGSAAAKNFHPPMPYNRIKPIYTANAASFDIRPTVDIEVDVDAIGKITGTSIVRWAGYGLDESVEHAVRSMNWRPADRGGKTLPMRVLLRYNFKRIEKE